MPCSLVWGQGNRQTIATKYDLDFMGFGFSNDTWYGGNTISSLLFRAMGRDSIRKVYGLFSYEKPVDFRIWKSITLPRPPQKELSVSAKVLFPTADSIQMVVYRVVDDPSQLAIDTATWRRPLSLHDSNISIQNLRLNIADRSTEDIQVHLIAYLPRVEKFIRPNSPKAQETGTLYSVDLYLDGEHLNDQKLPPIKPVELKSEHPIQQIGTRDKWDFSHLSFLDKHRIISFGETMHFNPAIQEAMQGVLLYLTKERGTNLILTEGLLSLSLEKNRYINDIHYDIDTSRIRPIEYQTLKNLREEVKRQKRPIYYLGIDTSNSPQGLGIDICNFLFSLPNWDNNLVICQLVDKLHNTSKLDEALEIIQTKKSDLRKSLTKEELAIIEFSLVQNIGLPASEGFERSYQRDRCMADNTTFLIGLLSPNKAKPVPIYAHLGHLAYRPLMASIATKPCGAYLKEKFGQELYTLAICTAGGETLVDKGFVGWTSGELAKMPEGTIEASLTKRSETPFFMTIPQEWNRRLQGRISGRWPSNFAPPRDYNIFHLVQGLLYIPGRSLRAREKLAIEDTNQSTKVTAQRQANHQKNVDLARSNLVKQ